jgi:ATP-dependent Clp protease ATP-binding subunit ClpB
MEGDTVVIDCLDEVLSFSKKELEKEGTTLELAVVNLSSD